MLDFIEEIAEARLFKGKETLKGKSAEDLAKLCFLMFLMIEILRNEEYSWTKDYINKTLSGENFSSLKVSATDLHNIIAVINNQEKYDDKIDSNKKIKLNIDSVKKYFRDITSKTKNTGTDRSFFMNLEDSLKIKNPALKRLRREVADWAMTTTAEKSSVKSDITRILVSDNTQNDISKKFQK